MSMEMIGPLTDENDCEGTGFKFPNSQIYLAVIDGSSGRVTGIRFKSVDGTTDIGTLSNQA